MASERRKKQADSSLSVRDLRRFNGLSLDEVANEARVDPTWLSRAERGRRPMTAERERAIREAVARLIERRKAVA